jgi:ectoine hydroxylase-related dioxygenase (phytanoyl-CoA dioxygenase family)
VSHAGRYGSIMALMVDRRSPRVSDWGVALRDAARSVEPVVLTSSQIELFFEQGFVVVDQMTSPEEVSVLRAGYDRLFHERAGEIDGLYTEASSDGSTVGTVAFPKIHKIFDLVPELRWSGFAANAARVATQLFGKKVRFLGGRAMMKPPMCPQHTPWHQDPAYHSPDRIYRNVNIWLSLQDCPLDAGAMQFVPRSHHGSVVLPHRRPGDRPDSNGLELADLSAVTEVVGCPLRAGGATLHHSYVLHQTPPNTTAAPRRALIAVFAAPPARRKGHLCLPWQEYAPPSDPGY